VGALRPFGLDCKQRHYAAQACFSGFSADLASLAVRRCDCLLLGAAQDSAQFLRRDLFITVLKSPIQDLSESKINPAVKKIFDL